MTNQKIGKRYSYRDHSGTHRREITGEFIQYGRRIYETKDLDTGEEGTAIADEIDKQFFPGKSQIIAKGHKGKAIKDKQKVY